MYSTYYCSSIHTSFLVSVGEEEDRGMGEGDGEGCRDVVREASPLTPPLPPPPFLDKGMMD